MTDTTVIEDEGQGEDLSLREELAAALATDTNSAQESAAPAPAAAEPPASDGRARDEHGRFAPKEGVQAAQSIPTEPKTLQAPAAAAEGPQAQQQPSGPPASWSAAAKADFGTLPEHIRQEVLKREADIQRGLAQQQSGAERLNRLTALFQPRAEKLRMAGVTEDQAIGQLLAAQDYLERDPVNAISYLARSYGVDLRVFGQGQGQQQPQEAQLPPVVQQLAQQVQALTNAHAQQQQQAQESQRGQYIGQVQAFATDPANLYFENVREKMAALIQTGAAKDLPDAYQQATWADPEIRPLLLKQQAEAQAAQTAEAARAKAAQARRASGSVTGSPAPGASPARGSQNPNASLRDDLTAAFAEHA